MNFEQLIKRILKITGAPTQFEIEQKELGLPVVKNLELKDENEIFEFSAMVDVAMDCEEKLKNGIEIPEDLTDLIFESIDKHRKVFESGNIPIFDLKNLQKRKNEMSEQDELMTNAILSSLKDGRKK